MPSARSSEWRRTGSCRAPPPERAEPMIPIRHRSRSALSSTRRMTTQPRRSFKIVNFVCEARRLTDLPNLLWMHNILLFLVWFTSYDKEVFVRLFQTLHRRTKCCRMGEIFIETINNAQTDNSTQAEWISKFAKISHFERITLLFSVYSCPSTYPRFKGIDLLKLCNGLIWIYFYSYNQNTHSDVVGPASDEEHGDEGNAERIDIIIFKTSFEHAPNSILSK